MPETYKGAGVDIDAGTEAVSRYRRLLGARGDASVLQSIGGFAGCFALEGFRDPVLVASTDSVGTKVLVAAALGRYDTIGRDLVHHCINDILCAGARPLFFLDYLAVGRLDVVMAEAVVGGVATACEAHSVALLGGETAEMPDLYAPPVFDLAGTIVGAVERDALIDPARVAVGDIVIGLPANGFHTNGYSLVRKVLREDAWREPVERGSARTVGDALLAVHPCYLPYVRALTAAGIAPKALAHITGGGLIDNVARVLRPDLAARFDSGCWQVPAIVQRVMREARLDSQEAYRVFNMGVGFCLIVGHADAGKSLGVLNAALAATPIPDVDGVRAARIGEVEQREEGTPAVIIT